jgi:ankyrin repeat protein
MDKKKHAIEAIRQACDLGDMHSIRRAVHDYEAFLNSELLSAATQGDADAVRAHVAEGADLGVTDASVGATLGMLAAGSGSVACMQALEDLGFDYTASPITDKGISAAHWAAAGGHLDCLAFLRKRGLLEEGARPPAQYSAAREAARYGNPHCLDVLLEHGTYLEADRLAHVAAEHGHLSCLEVLQQRGFPLDDLDDDGKSPLYVAVENDQVDCVRYLYAMAANLNLKDKLSATPILAASHLGKLAAFELLLELGADPNIPDRDGWLPIHYAAMRNRCEVLKNMLERGFAVDATTTKLNTAAHIAADTGHPESLEVLLCAGADLAAINKDGNNVRAVAAIADRKEVLHYLDAYMAHRAVFSTISQLPRQQA